MAQRLAREQAFERLTLLGIDSRDEFAWRLWENASDTGELSIARLAALELLALGSTVGWTHPRTDEAWLLALARDIVTSMPTLKAWLQALTHLGDPALDSSTYDWDNTCPAEQWKHSHNYMHHTFTNVVGKDRDVGYGIMRVTPLQPWKPAYLLQPFYFVTLMLLFEEGVALHEQAIIDVGEGKKKPKEILPLMKHIGRKIWGQARKDYIMWPGLAALVSIRGNATFTYDAGVEIDPAAGRLGELMVHHRRPDEAEAWERLVAGLA